MGGDAPEPNIDLKKIHMLVELCKALCHYIIT